MPRNEPADNARHDGDAPKICPTSGKPSNSALQYPHIRGISFQPFFGSGRRTPHQSQPPLNTADIILAAVGQSEGKLRF